MKKRKRKIGKATLIRRAKKKADQEARLLALKRDKKCVLCGSDFKTNVHHIIPREILPLRHDVENLICLCPKCHRFSRQCSPHKNSFVFQMWLEQFRQKQCAYLRQKLRELKMVPWEQTKKVKK